jgi:thioredoxin 1
MDGVLRDFQGNKIPMVGYGDRLTTLHIGMLFAYQSLSFLTLSFLSAAVFFILYIWRIMGAAVFIQDSTEFDQLLKAEPLLVVDCTATWCGPCRVIAPLIDQLAEAYAGRAKVFKLDLDANKAIAKQYGIKSIPAVMFFKQGELAETLVGVKPYEDFTSALDRHLS